MSETAEVAVKGVTIDEQITQALKKMPFTEIVIKNLAGKYLPLTVKGVDDKEGYSTVSRALSEMVKVRTSIEATRKVLKADSLKYGRAMDAEAARLTEL